ncbi:MAG: hypothetical protein BGO26_03195 [Actinobacteria bacterium 69-20]|jgi:simple sugar transport system permease protein|nr:ABC transporter permease [Actinomycetota bacterium]OJV23850.1 MAG: hypothetical protein BGO26_03195 [Actinobacteria bacterium 69-20]
MSLSPFDAALLASCLVLATPILLTSLGELISQRAGVMNVGLEGMMIFGAFFGFVGVVYSHSSWVGLLTGAVAGCLLSSVMAVLTVLFRADQIVVGIGINLIGSGATIFLNRRLFFGGSQAQIKTMASVPIPGLSNIPGIGRALFNQPIVVYLAYALIAVVALILFRSKFGLAARAAGELPPAVESAGIKVSHVRITAVLGAGFLAGLAGAFLSVVEVGVFVEGMSGGRGFLALAAVVFGKWRLRGVVFGALLFGGADALQLRLQSASEVPSSIWWALAIVGGLLVGIWTARRRFSTGRTAAVVILIGGGVTLALAPVHAALPSQAWLALPYVLSLVALASFVGQARMPSALAEPFDRESM